MKKQNETAKANTTVKSNEKASAVKTVDNANSKAISAKDDVVSTTTEISAENEVKAPETTTAAANTEIKTAGPIIDVATEVSEKEVVKTARQCRELALKGLSIAKIASAIGKSNSYTNKLVMLSRATEPVLSLIAAGKVSAWSTAEALKTDTPENVEKNINEAIQAAGPEATAAAIKIAISKSVISKMPPKQPRAKKQTPAEMIAEALLTQKNKIVEMLKAGATVADIEIC
jgi:hypothetical protein